jgi:hypothetical protein
MNYDSFSSGQYLSKLWLAQTVERIALEYLERPEGYKIWILAGWYGITNLILRTRNNIRISEVRSFDIDPSCESIADKINEAWVWQGWQFKAVTKDINVIDYNESPDMIINTSVEHIDSDQWFHNIPTGTLVFLQSSNLDHDDHSNVFNSTQEMMDRYALSEFLYDGIKYFDYGDHGFKRFMIAGIK